MSKGERRHLGQEKTGLKNAKTNKWINEADCCQTVGRCLTCNCYVSVRFAFINRVHDLIWAANESLGAALCEKEEEKEECEVGLLASSQTGFTRFLTCDMEGWSHLDIGYSVFVFVHGQIGLGHWK